MDFVTIEGLHGKVYVPDEKPENKKKHLCKDCYSCQMCSNDRCKVCLGEYKCCSSGGCNINE